MPDNNKKRMLINFDNNNPTENSWKFVENSTGSPV